MFLIASFITSSFPQLSSSKHSLSPCGPAKPGALSSGSSPALWLAQPASCLWPLVPRLLAQSVPRLGPAQVSWDLCLLLVPFSQHPALKILITLHFKPLFGLQIISASSRAIFSGHRHFSRSGGPPCSGWGQWKPGEPWVSGHSLLARRHHFILAGGEPM